MEPTISFFTNKATECVELIVMVSNEFVLRALPGVHKGKDHAVEYWTSISMPELQGYLSSDYEVARFLWGSMEKEETKEEEWNYSDALVWEIPPVQLWAKGHTLSRDYVESVADYMGDGDEFTVGDIVLEYPEFEPAESTSSVKDSIDRNERLCPWCGITGQKAFNYFTPNLLNYAELYLDFESPVLWTDGVWSDGGVDSSCMASSYTERGDSVISCPSCKAVFLASTIEGNTQVSGYETGNVESWIQPGTCARSEAKLQRTEAKFVEASLDQTLSYFKANLEHDPMINWEQWTAAQQVVGWASYLIRKGEQLTSRQDELGRQLLTQFSERVSQIKEGTLEAMSPHYRYEPDEEHRWHKFELFEAIPLANVSRIVRESEIQSSYAISGEDFKRDFEVLSERTDMDELYLYIEQRKLLNSALGMMGDSRWAVHSGELEK